MAKKPEPKPADPLQTESNDRLKEAKKHKGYIILDSQEAYFFTAPHRMRFLNSSTTPPNRAPGDAPELNTDLAMILAADFTTEVVNTYLPEAQNWCERRAGEGFEEAFEAVAEQVRKDDAKIFGAIKSSNLYAELPKAFNPDLYIGTAGLFIHRPYAHAPIEVLAVPMREMEINLGPNGEIDDRFIVRHTRNCYVKKLIGDTAYGNIKDDLKKEIEGNPAKTTEVIWGWWRKWDDTADEVWQHVIMVKTELVDSSEMRGQGCCAFLVMRFNPSADWPWAAGPCIQGLPTFRQIDELEMQKIQAVERSVNGPVTFPDDSFAATEQGFENGMAYPVRPGTANDVQDIYKQKPIDPVIYQTEAMEHRLRKISYCDHPEQSGDTPPTLGQWLDELARMQRRIGTAGYSFWREGPRAIFLRFKYLLEKGGTLQPIADKEGRAISTLPYNPTQRAAEQQEIATAAQAAQLMGQIFPEEFKLWIDGKMSMEAFIKKMRSSGLLIMRKPEEVDKALGQIERLIGGGQGQGGAQPPPAAAPA